MRAVERGKDGRPTTSSEQRGHTDGDVLRIKDLGDEVVRGTICATGLNG